MPTPITQIEPRNGEMPPLKGLGENSNQPGISNPERATTDIGTEPTVFKVEGTLYLRDAELLEKICRDVGDRTKRPVTLELSGLCYVDSNSAAVLCRMKRE